MFKKYSIKEIRSFLQAIDHHLNKKYKLILIGGTAAALLYKVNRYTQDIDTFSSIAGLKKPIEKAKKETRLNIPVEQAGAADAPYYFEERLIDLDDLFLKKLKIYIPEIHDLILMKVVRGYEHDFETIVEMCKKNKVKHEILKNRYIKEMSHVIGEKGRLKLNFLTAIEYAFGAKLALKIEKDLP